ncbi:uncharacterized protein LOC125675117 [Ostrea edulis]|uniref:uncharacterized protein LOC125675117 n=1 Tax=Ostrea edulis TaxID=37623 RepID=UPI0024AEAE6E|nr:uncharacterized protein LOC125675117 [Ostrea edulis]XP_048768574.2 uncharacterized protein LOC125675117 [Ostrea edulis]
MDSTIFDIAADNKQEMSEFVGRKKIRKTIQRIEIIKEKYAGVNMFLPPWATDAYFQSLHKQETKNFHVQENIPEDDTEDDTEDNNGDDSEEPLPWKLFMFNIDTFKIPMQETEKDTADHEELEDNTEPSMSQSSPVTNAHVELVPKPKKHGLRRRLLKFLGMK